jgi:type VI secretion system protein ImpL
LISTVGPQAWTVFRRASGTPLDHGIPGLFTLEGYRDVFTRRLPNMLNEMRDEEAWVMGRSATGTAPGLSDATVETGPGDPLLDDIRSLYLSEYAAHWQRFLADIHVARIDNRTLVLQTLRTFSSGNSPLLVLARAAAQQTALSQTPEQAGAGLAASASSLAAKAMDRFSSTTLDQARQAQAMLPDPMSKRQERELVDNRFAALHRMVSLGAGSAQAGAPLLEAITRMVDDYYALLLMADGAPSGQALPLQADARARLRLAAATSPAPLHNILTDLLQAGNKSVDQATGSRLHTQQQGVIGDSCSRTIAGRYPFAASAERDVSPDAFARVFAAGGTLDNFFQKNLAAYVDTTARPWRYRASGPDTQALRGPSLVPYERAQAIRETFFQGQDARQIAWKMDVKVVEMDPAITELVLDLDGQRLRYVHGPIQPLHATWPGPRGSMVAQLSVKPARPRSVGRAGQPASTPAGLAANTASTTISSSGPWALLKLLSRGRWLQGNGTEYLVEYDFDGRKAVLEISSDNLPNPQTANLLQAFRCPAVGR